jgi:NitT/TauT family transport system substrate-binding protein
MRRKAFVLVILVGFSLVTGGCRRRREPQTLRIGVLPILDTLPMAVAEEQGLFEEHGVAVDFIPVASAAERDQLVQTGKVDGIITDLVALALYNRESPNVVGVRYAMTPTEGFPQFRVLASADAALTQPQNLAGVPIGVSEGTVIEYVTDRLLEAEGLSPSEVQTLGVPRIPERMALLRSGELAAATLPEPLASLALQSGAVVVVDDTEHPETSCSVYAFRKAALDEQPETVRGFLQAVSTASRAINEDKGRWSDLLAEENLVPEPLLGSYRLPDYPADEAPSEAQFADAVDWLLANGRLSNEPSYADAVDASFLP